ncbi:MAG: VanZ family protein [Gemmiger sp.]|nr:VanZ family protein [Gemmiger sp.]
MQQSKINPWLLAFRVIFTLAVGGCILFIFGNSLQAAAVSSVRSQSVMRVLNSLLGQVHLGPLSEHIVRKLAHFSEYCLEGFLLTFCLRVYTVRFIRHISWPVLGGLLTALTDETIQLFVSGRASQLKDVWLDFAGVIAGILVALVALLLLQSVLNVYTVRRENRRLRAERDAYRAKASRYERNANYEESNQQKSTQPPYPTKREDLL